MPILAKMAFLANHVRLFDSMVMVTIATIKSATLLKSHLIFNVVVPMAIKFHSCYESRLSHSSHHILDIVVVRLDKIMFFVI